MGDEASLLSSPSGSNRHQSGCHLHTTRNLAVAQQEYLFGMLHCMKDSSVGFFRLLKSIAQFLLFGIKMYGAHGVIPSCQVA